MNAQKSILTKQMVIDMGVEHLQKLGFKYVSPENIMMEDVYKTHFVHMLHGMLGENEKTDVHINQLLNGMK